MTREDPARALDEAIGLVVGPGNGTWTRQRPIEEWQRLFRVFTDARAALAASPADGAGVDVERLATALHKVGRVLDVEGHCDNVEGADCLNPAWHRSDAEDIVAALEGASGGKK